MSHSCWHRGLGLSHDNCGLIVDALIQARAVRRTGGNLYQAPSLTDVDRRLAFETLATDVDLIREFGWKCYRISYLCVYEFLTAEDIRRRRWARFKQDWGFWLAVGGVVLALVALILQCLFWYHPKP